MTDLIPRALDVFQILESGDPSGAIDKFSERIRGYITQGWSIEDFVRDLWRPNLDDLAGSSRRVTEQTQVSPSAVLIKLDGDKGRAFVAISFDEDGGVGGFGVERQIFEGIGNVVIMCPYERVKE
jgi:hypothetical protein